MNAERPTTPFMNPTAHLTLRPPTALRLWMTCFGILWCGLLAWVIVLTAPRPSAIVPVLMLGLGGAFIWRLAAVAVMTDGDRLVIRNVYRTWQLPRRAVTGFRLGRDTATPVGYVVFALTDDEIVSLDVSRTPSRSQRAQRQPATLQEWLDADASGHA